jgi:hypothetical protein
MFRSRFTEAFPKSLANFGPQELERGVMDSLPGEHVEHLLCALLGLLLNRKQDVKYASPALPQFPMDVWKSDYDSSR